jgi:hypothetical protein
LHQQQQPVKQVNMGSPSVAHHWAIRGANLGGQGSNKPGKATDLQIPASRRVSRLDVVGQRAGRWGFSPSQQ